MKKSILAALVFSLLLGLSPLAADSTVKRGIDVFTTPADGKTFYDFAQNPIPAGFFCSGSEAFTGRIAFKGLPLVTRVPGQLRSTDTVVERLDDAVFNAKGTATTRIQFRALSLVSIAPLKTACGAFHAYVSLSGKQRVTTMNIQRTKQGGGSFAAPLAADIRLTFIPVKPVHGKNARKLSMTGRFIFPATSIPWSFTEGAKTLNTVVVDTNGDQIPDRSLPGLSNFFPGRSPSAPRTALVYCCYEYICHAGDGCQHCSWQYPPNCTAECP
ncbi:MAG TPA: hypothetical protein VH394_05145 [Thermoanaerobaculia bacterium]|nr:hypothetical protein [Thermoanaerobaculia bacterium]